MDKITVCINVYQTKSSYWVTFCLCSLLNQYICTVSRFWMIIGAKVIHFERLSLLICVRQPVLSSGPLRDPCRLYLFAAAQVEPFMLLCALEGSKMLFFCISVAWVGTSECQLETERGVDFCLPCQLVHLLWVHSDRLEPFHGKDQDTLNIRQPCRWEKELMLWWHCC